MIINLIYINTKKKKKKKRAPPEVWTNKNQKEGARGRKRNY